MKKQQDKTTFAAIVIVAIIAVIGLLGTSNFGAFNKIWYFTGFGTSALGTATINITGELSIKLSDMNITFGNGTFMAPALFAILESNNTDTINGTWVPVDDPFVLENDGNVNANITIKASATAASWFGGNAAYAAMYYKYVDSEAGSCLQNSEAIANETWAALPVSPATNETCQKLGYDDAADTMRVDLKIQVPADAPAGLKQNAVTFTASQSA